MNDTGNRNLSVGDGFRFGLGLWLSGVLVQGVVLLVGVALVALVFGARIRGLANAVDERIHQYEPVPTNAPWPTP